MLNTSIFLTNACYYAESKDMKSHIPGKCLEMYMKFSSQNQQGKKNDGDISLPKNNYQLKVKQK